MAFNRVAGLQYTNFSATKNKNLDNFGKYTGKVL